MSYATQQDIEERYPGALEQAGPQVDGELDATAIEKALQYADAVIAEQLTRRWPSGVPYSAPYPAWLIDLAVDLALYRATPAVLVEDFADRRARHNAAVDRLRRIGAGESEPPTPPTVASAVPAVTIRSEPRRFTRDRMKKLL